MDINIEIDTPDGIERHIEAVAEAYPEVLGRAAWQEFSKIMNAAKRITPVEYNFLRNSGVVQEPVVSDGDVKVEMGFYMNYAWYVETGAPHHTDSYAGEFTGEEAHHKPPTQSHFMRDSWLQFEPELLENLCRRIDHLIGGIQ
jgi:hypothetical protein